VILSGLARMKHEGKLPREQPIVLDSPMAIDTLKAIRAFPECLDPEKTDHLVGSEGRFFWVPNLKLGLRRGQELLPNSIVVASSGMLTGGRMIGHVQRHAGNPRNDLVFTGHSGPGSPARKIIDGATKVRVGDQEVEIRARVRRLSGFSGHGDQRQMIEYVQAFQEAPRKVVLVHGEPEEGEALQRAMQETTGIPTEFPVRGTTFVVE
jgi:metallo-beta-lactamase family protein